MTQRVNIVATLAFLVLGAVLWPGAASAAERVAAPTWAANPPQAFILPAIHPRDVKLQTKQLAPGVFALLSGTPAVDNSGFVVGRDGVLVIDAHINGAMARQIQAAVRRVTDKPILYLVNTNFHGDHTFGNYAFPATTTIIAQRGTAARMRHFEAEKEILLRAVENDPTVFAGARLRLPDMVFDSYLGIDLGGQVVELHHFGPGNTPGDTVVYVPGAKVAWTGNLILGAGTIPPIFEGGTGDYLATVARFAAALDVATIIPGHAAPTTGAIRARYVRYLGELIEAVRAAARAGWTLEETLANLPLAPAYLPPAVSEAAALIPYLNGLHQLNVQQTYLDLNGPQS